MVAALLSVFLVNANAASTPKTVRAEAFELVDAHGHVVARLTPANEGAELLLLSGGRIGARVTTAPGYPAVELYGNDGRPRVVAQVARGDSADFALYSEEGYRVHVAVSSGTQPVIELVSRDGRASQMLTFASKAGADEPTLTQFSGRGAVCATLGAEEDGSGRLSVMTPEGEPRAAAGGPDGLAVFGRRTAGETAVWKAPAPRPQLR